MIDSNEAKDSPILTKSFFERNVEVVAPDLIGCYLFMKIDGTRTGGMIIETEAYDENDPFSHCYTGASPLSKMESKPMSFEPGSAYFYWARQSLCINFVCHRNDFGSAVLIRALRPTSNCDEMYDRRIKKRVEAKRAIQKVFTNPETRIRYLCNGPAILCDAIGINEDHYKRSKTGLSLLEAPFEVRQKLKPLNLISGIRVGLDDQYRRWSKEQPDRAPLSEINSAAKRQLRWGAIDHIEYCSKPHTFKKEWTPI